MHLTAKTALPDLGFQQGGITLARKGAQKHGARRDGCVRCLKGRRQFVEKVHACGATARFDAGFVPVARLPPTTMPAVVRMVPTPAKTAVELPYVARSGYGVGGGHVDHARWRGIARAAVTRFHAERSHHAACKGDGGAERSNRGGS